ncbi:MAG: hypothetical protein EXR69_00345 [Myxococcales bacterium]|nr:hypothetical protein [Myxococcales bacterium]
MSEPSDADTRGVLAANDAFYRAFVAGDALRMDLVWAGHDGDTCIHPWTEAVIGPINVQNSWRRLFASGDRLSIRISDLRVDLYGGAAKVHLIENVSGAPTASGSFGQEARVACTNVFLRTDDGWRMTLHHGGVIAAGHEPELEPDPDTGEFN